MADTAAGSPSIDQLVRSWEGEGIRHVLFELPDMHGVSRSKIIPIKHVERYATRGLNMYGGTVTLDSASSVVGGTLYNEEVSYADQLLVPDVDSAAILPWEPATARLICDGRWLDGRPQAAAPRHVLKRLIDQAEARGYVVRAGFEYEFYVLDGASGQPSFGGIHIFNSIRNTYVPVVARILDYMPRAGVDLITANCEYGPSQFEINFSANVGIRAADDAFTFKNGVKAIAHQLGYNATFMTKPFSDQSASGCHVHLSLSSRETGRNLFLAEDGEDGLSRECRCFIQGLLDHAPAGMALMAPTVNCYHRFVPHHFAPSNVSWGIEDRTAMVRAKSSRDENTHLENRLPTALSNPYLALAATLAGGLLGLGRGKPATTPGAGPAEDQVGHAPLPGSLEAALAALEADEELCGLLGQEFVGVYTTMKRFELQRFRRHVTDWERSEYLEIY